MKSLKFLVFYSFIGAFMGCFFSCKKDKTQPAVDVIYTVDVDGLTATFTNQTKGVKTYKWDFGDGTTSNEQNPVHTYSVKGKYVPTLYVSTVAIIIPCT
jgi:PKD repeat protein